MSYSTVRRPRPGETLLVYAGTLLCPNPKRPTSFGYVPEDSTCFVLASKKEMCLILTPTHVGWCRHINVKKVVL